ncbi:MAG: hypothetical protein ABH867_00620 [Patescibacteria group bacterium]|nr:hypothetical protein [Patescibacteria group bacterium]
MTTAALVEKTTVVRWRAGVGFLRREVGLPIRQARSLSDPEAVELIFERIEITLRNAAVAVDVGLLDGSELVTVHGGRLGKIKERILKRCVGKNSPQGNHDPGS